METAGAILLAIVISPIDDLAGIFFIRWLLGRRK
jgi:hypothetical protein